MNSHLAREVRTRVLPELEMWALFIVRRLPKSFEGLAEEAEQVADDEWERFQRRSFGGEDEDQGFAAERATDLGQQRYERLMTIENSTYSALAIALYHWHEQWVLQLYRERFAPMGAEECDSMKDASAWSALKAFKKDGVDLLGTEAGTKVNELRLLANVLKHGVGDSCDELYAMRPDYFHPVRMDFPVRVPSPSALLQPLSRGRLHQ